MPKGILLTQYSAAAARSARAPALLPHAGALQAPLLVHYRSVEDPEAGAVVEYSDQLGSVAPVAQWAPAADGVARYACLETQDSGACPEPNRVLMIIAFCVPDERTEEVERWYIEEHGPLLLRAPGWLRMRRYEPLSYQGGPRWTHIAMHELRNLAVLDSAERAYARSTPWRARLEEEAWFPQAGRWVYERLNH